MKRYPSHIPKKRFKSILVAILIITLILSSFLSFSALASKDHDSEGGNKYQYGRSSSHDHDEAEGDIDEVSSASVDSDVTEDLTEQETASETTTITGSKGRKGSGATSSSGGQKTDTASIEISPDIEALAESGSPFFMVVGETEAFDFKINPPSADVDLTVTGNDCIEISSDYEVKAVDSGLAELTIEAENYQNTLVFSVFDVLGFADEFDPGLEGSYPFGWPIPLPATGEVTLDIQEFGTLESDHEIPDGDYPDVYDYPLTWSFTEAPISDDSTWTIITRSSIFFTNPGTYILKASTGLVGVSEEYTVIIDAIDSSYVPVETASFDQENMSIYIQSNTDADVETFLSVGNYTPVPSNTETLIWEAENDIVKLIPIGEDGLMCQVIGLSAGDTIIRLSSVQSDGSVELLDSCPIGVSLNPNLTDPVYIKAVDIDTHEELDQFDALEDIYIIGTNIPAIDDGGDEAYYIRLDQMGTSYETYIRELNDSDYEFNDGVLTLTLSDIHGNPIELGDAFSKEYFVSITIGVNVTEDTVVFETGDDDEGLPKTWTDNFKITSPIPTGYIYAGVALADSDYDEVMMSENKDHLTDIYERTIDGQGNESDEPRGYEVILARVLFDEDGDEAGTETVEDYMINPDYEPAPGEAFDPMAKYSDEVKMVGYLTLYDEDHADSIYAPFDNTVTADGTYGYVEWDVPREPLKIGGYMLLINLPDGYSSNLDWAPDTTSEDGALLKEVSIRRDAVVTRPIVIYEPE